MARILGNTFFMEARLSTRKKKDSSQPSMIAMLVNSGSTYICRWKKNKRKMANEWECVYCGTTW